MLKRNTQNKTNWLIILFMAVVNFIIALKTGHLIFNVIAITLAIYVYKFGYTTLFKEYDEKKKAKYQKAKIINEAAQTAIRTKKILK